MKKEIIDFLVNSKVNTLPVNGKSVLRTDAKTILKNFLLPEGCIDLMFFITRPSESRINVFSSDCRLISIIKFEPEGIFAYGSAFEDTEQVGFVKAPSFFNPFLNIDEACKKAEKIFRFYDTYTPAA